MTRAWEYVLGTLGEAEKEELEAGRAPEELAREIHDAQELSAAVAASLPPVAPPAEVKRRLFESLADPEPFAAWVDKLARMLDTGVAEAREILKKVRDPASWVGGADGFALMHITGGPATAGADVGFIRAPAGFRFPKHLHRGDEHVLVFQGRLRDTDGGLAGPGDLVFKPAGSIHGYAVEGREDCVYATVLHGFELLLEEGGPPCPEILQGYKSEGSSS